MSRPTQEQGRNVPYVATINPGQEGASPRIVQPRLDSQTASPLPPTAPGATVLPERTRPLPSATPRLPDAPPTIVVTVPLQGQTEPPPRMIQERVSSAAAHQPHPDQASPIPQPPTAGEHVDREEKPPAAPAESVIVVASSGKDARTPAAGKIADASPTHIQVGEGPSGVHAHEDTSPSGTEKGKGPEVGVEKVVVTREELPSTAPADTGGSGKGGDKDIPRPTGGGEGPEDPGSGNRREGEQRRAPDKGIRPSTPPKDTAAGSREIKIANNPTLKALFESLPEIPLNMGGLIDMAAAFLRENPTLNDGDLIGTVLERKLAEDIREIISRKEFQGVTINPIPDGKKTTNYRFRRVGDQLTAYDNSGQRVAEYDLVLQAGELLAAVELRARSSRNETLNEIIAQGKINRRFRPLQEYVTESDAYAIGVVVLATPERIMAANPVQQEFKAAGGLLYTISMTKEDRRYLIREARNMHEGREGGVSSIILPTEITNPSVKTMLQRIRAEANGELEELRPEVRERYEAFKRGRIIRNIRNRHLWNLLAEVIPRTGYTPSEKRPPVILTLGCGDNEEARVNKVYFSGNSYGSLNVNARLIGIDNDPVALAKAQQINRNDIFVQGDPTNLATLSRIPSQADVVVLRHQTPNQLLFGQGLSRLAEEGIMLVTSHEEHEHQTAVEMITMLNQEAIEKNASYSYELVINEQNPHATRLRPDTPFPDDAYILVVKKVGRHAQAASNGESAGSDEGSRRRRVRTRGGRPIQEDTGLDVTQQAASAGQDFPSEKRELPQPFLKEEGREDTSKEESPFPSAPLITAAWLREQDASRDTDVRVRVTGMAQNAARRVFGSQIERAVIGTLETSGAIEGKSLSRKGADAFHDLYAPTFRTIVRIMDWNEGEPQTDLFCASLYEKIARERGAILPLTERIEDTGGNVLSEMMGTLINNLISERNIPQSTQEEVDLLLRVFDIRNSHERRDVLRRLASGQLAQRRAWETLRARRPRN